MRHRPAENVGVEHHDNSDDGAQGHRVPYHKPENNSLIAHLLGSRGGNRDGLRIYHFPHDAACAIRGAHQNRVDTELLRRNSLQASEERVR